MSEETGICGKVAPGWKVRMSCVLPKGHSGNHEDSYRCWWRNYSYVLSATTEKGEEAL